VHRYFTDAHDPLPPSPDLLGFSFAWELDYANLLGWGMVGGWGGTCPQGGAGRDPG
jgi:hypothetical protein